MWSATRSRSSRIEAQSTSLSDSTERTAEHEEGVRHDVKRLNHAVLWVRDARGQRRVLQRRSRVPGRRADASGLRRSSCEPAARPTTTISGCSVSASAPPPPHRPGCTTWPGRSTRSRISPRRPPARERGALVGESDHGVVKSLYAKDPDGIEFEVMWAVPRERVADEVTTAASPRPRRRARAAGPACRHGPSVAVRHLTVEDGAQRNLQRGVPELVGTALHTPGSTR